MYILDNSFYHTDSETERAFDQLLPIAVMETKFKHLQYKNQ